MKRSSMVGHTTKKWLPTLCMEASSVVAPQANYGAANFIKLYSPSPSLHSQPAHSRMLCTAAPVLHSVALFFLPCSIQTLLLLVHSLVGVATSMLRETCPADRNFSAYKQHVVMCVCMSLE